MVQSAKALSGSALMITALGVINEKTGFILSQLIFGFILKVISWVAESH